MRRIEKLASQPVSLQTLLIERAARVEGISIKKMMLKDRTKEAVLARSIVMYLGMMKYKISSSTIGQWFGGMDGSTVRHNAYKIRDWLRYPEISLKVKKVDISSRNEIKYISVSDYIFSIAVVKSVERGAPKIYYLQKRLSETNDDKTRKLLFNEYRKKWKSSCTS